MEQGKMHIDELFRRKVQAQPPPPLPPAAWDDMKLRLDKGGPKGGFRYHWLWYGLALLFVAGPGIYFLKGHPGGAVRNEQVAAPQTEAGLRYNAPAMTQAITTTIQTQPTVAGNSRAAIAPAMPDYHAAFTKHNPDITASLAKGFYNTPDKPISFSNPKGGETRPALPNAVATPAREAATTPKAETKQTNATTSDTISKSTVTDDTDTAMPKARRRLRLPLSYGLKAGYEAGAGQPSVNKFLVAPFLEYRLGNHLALSIQPAIKSGRANGIAAPGGGSFYSLTGTTVDSQTIQKNGRPFWQITYTQAYDSIVVSYVAGSSAVELELPLMLRYYFPNGLSLGAGGSLAFGKLIPVEDGRQSTHLSQAAVFQIEKAGTHPPPDTSASFHHTAAPYGSYVPLGQAAQSPVRIGYLLSAGYERQHWLLEATLQQTVAGLSGVTAPGVKDAYSIPYIRLLLGYCFSKK